MGLTRTSQFEWGLLYISTVYGPQRVLHEDKQFGPAPVKSPPICHELGGGFVNWSRSTNNSPMMITSKTVSMSHRNELMTIMKVFVFDCLLVPSSRLSHCFSSPDNDSSTSVLDSSSSWSSMIEIVSLQVI